MAGPSSVSFSIQKLKGRENYTHWKFQMANYLKHEELWKCIIGFTESDKISEENRIRMEEKALSKINLMVEMSVVPHLLKCKTSKEAWHTLEAVYEDKGLNRRLSLLRKLCSIRFNKFKSMEDYINDIMYLSEQLSSMQQPLDDEFLGAIMLQGLPEEYEPMIMALESSGQKVTSDFVKTKLLQDIKCEKYSSCNNNALISEQNCGYIKPNNSKNNSNKIQCRNCGRFGHVKYNCPIDISTSHNNKGKSTIFYFKDKKRQFSSKEGEKKKSMLSMALGTCRANKTSWIIDSGASAHMTRNKKWMVDYVESDSQNITLADGRNIKGFGTGTVPINSENINKISNVLYVPNLATNLISVNKVVNQGMTVVFGENKCCIYNNCEITGDPLITASKRNGVYHLDVEYAHNINEHINISSSELNMDQMLWHRRLGHLNRISMNLLKNKLAEGVNYDEDTIRKCESCIEGKMIQIPFPKSSKRAKEKLELIHMDVCGPFSIPSFSKIKKGIFLL